MGVQTNGQLMGSPMSFPVLCLANLLVYMLVHPGLSAGEAVQRVLVNGDDMLYKGSLVDWEAHKRIAASVGLIMSPGKAYVHPSYSNANSTGFWETKDRVRPVPFVNFGLFFGNHKVMSEEDKMSATVSSVGPVISGCWDDDMATTVLGMYLRKWNTNIKDETRAYCRTSDGRQQEFFRNLFLPTSLGGMGLPVPKGFKFRVNDFQKAVAIAMADQANRPGPFEVFPLGMDPRARMVAQSELFMPWPVSATACYSIPSLDMASGSIRRRWRDLGIWQLGFVLVPLTRNCHE